MDKKEMFSKVGEILKELNEQYEYLSKSPDKMNELEIELFVANSNFLADHIKIVQKLNNVAETAPVKPVAENQHTPEKPDAAPEKKEPAEAAEEKPAPPEEAESPAAERAVEKEQVEERGTEKNTETDRAVVSQDDFRFEFEKEVEEDTATGADNAGEKPEAQVEPSQKPHSNAEASKKPSIAEEPVSHTVIIREKTISLDTPAKTSTEPAPTLNDVMAAQLDQSTVAGKYNRQSVGDLKSIISLNDKLLFVKDLFNGYSLAYSEAIELLNRFDNLDSADNFLKTNYSVKNNWSDKQSTVDKFYEILNRRFTK